MQQERGLGSNRYVGRVWILGSHQGKPHWSLFWRRNEKTSRASMWRKNILSRGKSKCKSLEAGMYPCEELQGYQSGSENGGKENGEEWEGCLVNQRSLFFEKGWNDNCGFAHNWVQNMRERGSFLAVHKFDDCGDLACLVQHPEHCALELVLTIV